tara:strand:- start:2807 stop:3019 length:213 start_codon:yes stop_codon:yes gene_type:complete
MSGKKKMKHLKENNETYLEHMGHALSISYLLLAAGTKCFIHAVVPHLFEKGVSSKLDDLSALVKRNETTD